MSQMPVLDGMHTGLPVILGKDVLGTCSHSFLGFQRNPSECLQTNICRVDQKHSNQLRTIKGIYDSSNSERSDFAVIAGFVALITGQSCTSSENAAQIITACIQESILSKYY